MNGIRGYLIRSDKLCSRVETLVDLEAAVSDSTKTLWLDIQGELDHKIEAELVRVLNWHPIVLQNFHTASSRPKLINFEGYSQVTLHALNFNADKSDSPTVEIDIVIAKSYVITYHKQEVQSIEQTLEDLKKGELHLAPDELLYHIVSHMIDKYVPEVENKNDLVKELEQEALFSPGKDLLERIVLIRDEIIELGVALGPQQMILAQLATGVCRSIRPFIRPYFRDAETRMRNLIDEQSSYKEMLANSLELYRSTMSSRTNDTMKVLTALSTLFLPLTFLTGLFGMNVHLPLTTHQHAFITIIGLCLLSFVGMMGYFKWKRWF